MRYNLKIWNFIKTSSSSIMLWISRFCVFLTFEQIIATLTFYSSFIVHIWEFSSLLYFAFFVLAFSSYSWQIYEFLKVATSREKQFIVFWLEFYVERLCSLEEEALGLLHYVGLWLDCIRNEGSRSWSS